MDLEFPYQIVTFLGREPQSGEPVYYGEKGWYTQLALKRRFKLQDIDESQLIQLLQPFSESAGQLIIKTGPLVKPERMPVRVIDIENQSELISLHKQLIARLNGDIISRYPDREGDNYYAHITAEHSGALTIPTDDYTDREFTLYNIWLLKDIGDENSIAYIKLR